MDKSGAKTSDALSVVVEPSPYLHPDANNFPVTFTLKFDYEYAALMNQPQHKMQLVSRGVGDSQGGFCVTLFDV